MTGGGDPFEVALRQLERRARTRQEVRRKLRGRGFGAAEVDDVIARLSGLGYLDDRSLAIRYTAWSAEQRPMGRRRIALELMRRGVDRDTIDEVLAGSFDAGQESAALARALARAARGVKTPLDEKARRRLASHLIRRGFPPGRVMEALRRWADPADAERAEDDREARSGGGEGEESGE